ncbi:hypothetical protein D3C74_354310 [compost metagenome]
MSAPTSLARATIGATGVIAPVTFEACVNATTRVRSVMTEAASSTRMRPSSSTPNQRSTAPVRAASSCHGTRFAWCSASVRTISSPGARAKRRAASPPRPIVAFDSAYVTRLIAAVAPEVHTISSASAPTKRATADRASSNASVASSASWCAPRCTAALRSS